MLQVIWYNSSTITAYKDLFLKYVFVLCCICSVMCGMFRVSFFDDAGSPLNQTLCASTIMWKNGLLPNQIEIHNLPLSLPICYYFLCLSCDLFSWTFQHNIIHLKLSHLPSYHSHHHTTKTTYPNHTNVKAPKVKEGFFTNLKLQRAALRSPIFFIAVIGI